MEKGDSSSVLNYKLSTFLELCETRNYTKTAENLHMTQPAVTQHIKYLEKYYETKLFYYDERKKIHLTDQGRLLRSYAQTVKSDTEIVKSKLSAPADKPDEFKLGSLTGTGETFAAKMMGKYLEKYPGKKIGIYMGEADDLLIQLANGRVQSCIVDKYCPPDEYECHELFESETICICSPKHPLAGRTVNFKELNKYRLIFREENSNSYSNLRSILHGYNQDINDFASYIEVGTINTIHNLVRDNVGISFVYKFVVQKNLDQGAMSQIYIRDFKCKTYINYVWMKHSFFTVKNREFLNICREYLSDHGELSM